MGTSAKHRALKYRTAVGAGVPRLPWRPQGFAPTGVLLVSGGGRSGDVIKRVGGPRPLPHPLRSRFARSRPLALREGDGIGLLCNEYLMLDGRSVPRVVGFRRNDREFFDEDC